MKISDFKIFLFVEGFCNVDANEIVREKSEKSEG